MRKYVCLLSLLALTAMAGPAPAVLDVTLRPGAVGEGGRIACVDVKLVYSAFAPVQLAFLPNNVETAARSLGEVRARDAAGALALRVSDDDEGAAGAARRWSAARAARGAVTLEYRVPITNRAAPRGAAPPLELRSDGGAISGAGETFLLLPVAAAPMRVRLHWDLSLLPSGARAVSSFGAGSREVEAADVAARLKPAYFMAGMLDSYPLELPEHGFFAAWHGAPPIDLRRMMVSEEQLFRLYEGFFAEQKQEPYGVFLRENPVNPGGGMELNGSFVATFGVGVSEEDLSLTIAHEMLHTFAGGLDEPAGLEGSWFSEGLAVHYARLLALRGGRITAQQFLRDLNATAARYYTNAFLSAPNAEIPKRFWADTRIRVLPYDRGSLYFAALDTKLRAASQGERGLDELLREFLGRRKRGLKLDEAAWCGLLLRELGPDGPAAFRAMLEGAVQLPESRAFGPQFERYSAKLRRYELGFAPEGLIEPRRMVRGLVAGSAAERAGLRNGDEILRPVPQDGVQARQDATLTLEVLRGAQRLTITYLPRAELVDAWQWRAVAALQ